MELTWHFRKNEFLLWFWRHLNLSTLKLTNLSPRKTIYSITTQYLKKNTLASNLKQSSTFLFTTIANLYLQIF